MKNNDIPATPEGWTRAWTSGIATMLMAAALSACGGGGGGTPPAQQPLSADQKVYEDAVLHGGLGGISYNMPYGGGNLVSGSSAIYSTLTVLPASPLSGAVTVTPTVASVTASLSVPTLSKSWYLAGGNLVSRSATASEQVSYNGTAVRLVRYADDNKSVVDSFDETAFREVALTGPATSAPAELLAALPLDQWAAGGNFSATTAWQPGAFYVARKEALASDRTLLEPCYPTVNLPVASTLTLPPPCRTSGTLAGAFPLTLYYQGSTHPRETFAAADGTIATVQGLQVWTANDPEPRGLYATPAYRVFIQQGANIYVGILQHQGTPTLSTLTDGSIVTDGIALNQAAIASVGPGVVLAPTSVRQTTGFLRGLSTVDLFGIGGTGVDGALSPQDLRAHYDVPAALDGTGQTIAVVDAPGPSWINYVDDLDAYSRAFGLPVCAITASACLQHVDLSFGVFTGTGNGGASEATLDIEMVHAIAPGAQVVLVTAASSSLSDMMAAVNYAASLPAVTAVSASWGYNYAADASQIPNEETQLAQFVAQGKAFFASSGDAGQFPGSGPTYPAISAYFTAVGGTRIHAVAPAAGTSSDTSWQFSGGGFTPWMAVPAWQQTFIGATENALNTGKRAVPDVSAVADVAHSPVAMYFRQRWVLEGGTSVGAPVWAGIAALIAQQQVANGTTLAARVAGTPGGFNGLLYRSQLFDAATPALQALAGGTSFAQALACSTCSVVPGYNDVAGLGTPDVASLITSF